MNDQTTARAQLRALLDEPDDDQDDDQDPKVAPTHEEPLEALRRRTGLPVRAVRKLGLRGGVYELELEGGVIIDLGTAGQVLKPTACQAAIADDAGIVIRNRTRASWLPIARAIIDAAGPGEDIETTHEAETRSWLRDYLYTRAPWWTEPVDLDAEGSQSTAARDIAENHGAFGWTTDRRLVIRPDYLTSYVTLHFGARTAHSDVRLRLKRLGFTRRQLSARTRGGEVTKVRVWISPPGFDPDDDESGSRV